MLKQAENKNNKDMFLKLSWTKQLYTIYCIQKQSCLSTKRHSPVGTNRQGCLTSNGSVILCYLVINWYTVVTHTHTHTHTLFLVVNNTKYFDQTHTKPTAVEKRVNPRLRDLFPGGTGLGTGFGGRGGQLWDDPGQGSVLRLQLFVFRFQFLELL